MVPALAGGLLLAGVLTAVPGGAAPALSRGGAEGGRVVAPTAEAQPEWLRGILGQVNAAQRQLNRALSRELGRLRDGDVSGAALTLGWIAFLYGVLHAVGPGHGKLVVSSLFLGRDARLPTAIAVSGLVSLLQAVSAIAVVSVMALVLGRGGLDVLRDSRRIELVSYGLIATVGGVMLVLAARDVWVHRGARPPEPAADGGRRAARRRRGGAASAGVVLAAGLTPCASAVIVLLFALGQGVFLIGVAAALVMAVGMGLTVAVVGLLAVAARHGAVRAAGASSREVHWVKEGLGLAGAAAIAAIGSLLFLDAWTRS